MPNPPPAATREFITSIVDLEEIEKREHRLANRKQAAQGKRGKPPMTDRLREVASYVEYLEQREGVRFATARNSVMNKLVQAWMNERIGRTSKLPRKSLGADAVKNLLKDIAKLRS